MHSAVPIVYIFDCALSLHSKQLCVFIFAFRARAHATYKIGIIFLSGSSAKFTVCLTLYYNLIPVKIVEVFRKTLFSILKIIF